jgi:hypothetical protein
MLHSGESAPAVLSELTESLPGVDIARVLVDQTMAI